MSITLLRYGLIVRFAMYSYHIVVYPAEGSERVRLAGKQCEC